jgi:hypothetical protein
MRAGLLSRGGMRAGLLSRGVGYMVRGYEGWAIWNGGMSAGL